MTFSTSQRQVDNVIPYESVKKGEMKKKPLVFFFISPFLCQCAFSRKKHSVFLFLIYLVAGPEITPTKHIVAQLAE